MSDSQFIIFGGRTSPAKPCISTVILSLENHEDCLFYKLNTLVSDCCVPTPRWRHSAVMSTNKESLIVYGGCTTGRRVLDDLWWVEIRSGIWQKVCTINKFICEVLSIVVNPVIAWFYSKLHCFE